jgi:hypothetical protein
VDPDLGPAGFFGPAEKAAILGGLEEESCGLESRNEDEGVKCGVEVSNHVVVTGFEEGSIVAESQL